MWYIDVLVLILLCESGTKTNAGILICFRRRNSDSSMLIDPDTVTCVFPIV